MKIPAATIPAKLPIALKGLMIPVLGKAQPTPFGSLVRSPSTKGAEIKAGPQAMAAPPPAPKHEKPLATKGDDLDPMARHAAQLAPPIQTAPIAVTEPSSIVETHARVSLEEILPQLV